MQQAANKVGPSHRGMNHKKNSSGTYRIYACRAVRTKGVGSTGVACLNTGREFVGMELDLEYYQIAKERIEQHVENIF